jgi:hypothetical protein
MANQNRENEGGPSTSSVWAELDKRIFAVLGTVSPKGAPLTSGIVYKVKDRRILIATGRSTQKARNVEAHPRASMTVTADRRIPFLPWVKIPPATITFGGAARLLPPGEVDAVIREALIGKLSFSPEALADMCYIEVEPTGSFVTYGIGVSLHAMLRPGEALSRVPV